MPLIERSDFVRQSVHCRFGCHETDIPDAVSCGPESPMRLTPTTTVRCILASLMGLLGFVCPGAGDSRAADADRQPIAIEFSYDRPINAGAAPFVLASTRGLFAAEGLAVTTDIASGSPEAIARVALGGQG